jgi:hypothetical protein
MSEDCERMRRALQLIVGTPKTDDPAGDREHMRLLARMALSLPDPRKPDLYVVSPDADAAMDAIAAHEKAAGVGYGQTEDKTQ